MEGVKGGIKAPMPAKIHENGAENRRFRSKVLTKIYSQDVI
jgi:hypothetical protein